MATVTLFLLVRWRLGPVRPPGRTALALVGLGMLGFGGYQVLWSIGLTQITAGDSALIVAGRPGAHGAARRGRGDGPAHPAEAPRARWSRSRASPSWSTAGQELSLGASLVGELLTLGAAVLWAVYTIAGTRMLRQVDPLQATAWAVLGGTLFLLPFGACEIATSPPPDVTPAAVLGILYSGAFAAAVANVLVFNAIRLVGPSRVTVSQFLVPVGAVVLGAVFLAEPVGIAQVAGGAVIVLGVWLTRRRACCLPTAMRARSGDGSAAADLTSPGLERPQRRGRLSPRQGLAAHPADRHTARQRDRAPRCDALD